jgi:hypothetical protein
MKEVSDVNQRGQTREYDDGQAVWTLKHDARSGSSIPCRHPEEVQRLIVGLVRWDGFPPQFSPTIAVSLVSGRLFIILRLFYGELRRNDQQRRSCSRRCIRLLR